MLRIKMDIVIYKRKKTTTMYDARIDDNKIVLVIPNIKITQRIQTLSAKKGMYIYIYICVIIPKRTGVNQI